MKQYYEINQNYLYESTFHELNFINTTNRLAFIIHLQEKIMLVKNHKFFIIRTKFSHFGCPFDVNANQLVNPYNMTKLINTTNIIINHILKVE